MNRLARACVLVWIGCLGWTANAPAASARILKVLPHFLDREGRHTPAPSLYERDAYQAYLRQHPEKRSGLRFDVQWKTHGYAELTLRVEMRGSDGRQPTQALLEKRVRRRHWYTKTTWSAVTLQGARYKQFGELLAWRATLWNHGTLVAEQKSFLW